jgi:hypothetical protein
MIAPFQFTWIGFTDLVTEGSWAHVTGEPSSFPGDGGAPWRGTEPNNGTGGNCAHLFDNGELADFTCGNSTSIPAYLCECDTHSVAPPSQ